MAGWLNLTLFDDVVFTAVFTRRRMKWEDIEVRWADKNLMGGSGAGFKGPDPAL
jgi:hypothetical protein